MNYERFKACRAADTERRLREAYAQFRADNAAQFSAYEAALAAREAARAAFREAAAVVAAIEAPLLPDPPATPQALAPESPEENALEDLLQKRLRTGV